MDTQGRLASSCPRTGYDVRWQLLRLGCSTLRHEVDLAPRLAELTKLSVILFAGFGSILIVLPFVSQQIFGWQEPCGNALQQVNEPVARLTHR